MGHESVLRVAAGLRALAARGNMAEQTALKTGPLDSGLFDSRLGLPLLLMAEEERGVRPLLRAAGGRGRINLGVEWLLGSLSRCTRDRLGCRTSLTRTGDHRGLRCAATLILPTRRRASPRILLLEWRCRAVGGSGISHRAAESSSAATRLAGSACDADLRPRRGARRQSRQPRTKEFSVLSYTHGTTPFERTWPSPDGSVNDSSEIRRAD